MCATAAMNESSRPSDTIPNLGYKINHRSATGPRQNLHEFGHLLPLISRIAAADRVLHAMSNMILEHRLFDTAQRCPARRRRQTALAGIRSALQPLPRKWFRCYSDPQLQSVLRRVERGSRAGPTEL